MTTSTSGYETKYARNTLSSLEHRITERRLAGANLVRTSSAEKDRLAHEVHSQARRLCLHHDDALTSETDIAPVSQLAREVWEDDGIQQAPSDAI